MPIDSNRIQAVFLLAAEASDAAARAQVLNRECGADAELRQRVEALLAAHDASGGFLDRPPRSPLSTVDEPRLSEGPGVRIGPYKLLQQIGEGGMGVVFLAEQLEPMQRQVAVKVIKPGMDTQQVVARFEAERQALALMDHPNIAKVLDAGATDSGRPYFVMELVKGLPITKYCDQEHLTPQERLQLFVPICHAVQHAHQKGIIHRDLKPSNILIGLYDGKPVPKVIDFGVAKATGIKLTERTLFTEVGHAIGTWEYMSPEQAELNNLDIDTRADIYALGATLYQLLTGSPPFTRQQLRNAAFEEMLRMIREVEPPKPSTRLFSSDELPALAAKRKLEPAKLSRLVRGDLDWIVMKCLEKERGRRYETANGLAMDIQRYLADEPVLASPPSAAYRLRKFVRRHKGKLLTAALVGLVLLLAAGSFGWALWDRAAQRAINRAEKILQARQNHALAETSLARLDDLYKQYLWTEADALVEGAKKLVGPDGDADLLDRIAHARRKTIVFRDLDGASMTKLRWTGEKFDFAGTAEAYRKAFANFGLNVQADPVEALARRISDEEPVIRDALLVGLDHWSFCDPSRAKVRALAQAADMNPWRQKYRRAVTSKDKAALLNLSQEARGLSLPATSLHLLALYLDQSGQIAEAVALLRWARDRHPDDFWIAMELGNFLQRAKMATDPVNLEEVVGCFRVAVALRPTVSSGHFNLGLALNEKGQPGAAVDELKKALALDPKDWQGHDNLGRVLASMDQFDNAIAEHKRAIAIDPTQAAPHVNLGHTLQLKGLLEAAIVEYNKAIGLNPKFANAHHHLGSALAQKSQLNAAIAAYKRAITLDPKNAVSHFDLGTSLLKLKQWDAAILELRKSIDLDPKYAQAYYHLGLALLPGGRFGEALDLFKQADRLSTPHGPAWRTPPAKLAAYMERLVKLEARLPAVLKGEDRVGNSTELKDFNEVCRLQQRYTAAFKLFTAAFTTDPKLADDMAAWHRYNAACYAALTAAGQGIDADKLDDKERARLRRQALEWLRADLAYWTKQAVSEKPADRNEAKKKLKHWQADSDLVGVREKDAVAKLPAAERAAWEKLWAEVRETLKKATEGM